MASAITDKGITTDATDTFEQMATNIQKLSKSLASTKMTSSQSYTQSVTSGRYYLVFIGTRGTTDYKNIALSSGGEQIWVKRVYKSCSSGAGLACFFIKATSSSLTFSTVEYYAQCVVVDITDIMTSEASVTATTAQDKEATASVSVTKNARYIMGLILGSDANTSRFYSTGCANILNKKYLCQYYSSTFAFDMIHYSTTSGWDCYAQAYSAIIVKVG